MIKCKCEYCGEEFEVKYESLKHKYCSHKCANLASLAQRRKQIEKTCAYCGKAITMRASDRRAKREGDFYCSARCRNIANGKGRIISCLYCGKLFYTTRRKFCSRECFYNYGRPNYEHKKYSENGYECVFIKGYNKKGNVKVHRLIVETALGRKLSADEVVHHINGNKTDNRLENLLVMTREDHVSWHRKPSEALREKYPKLKVVVK